MTAQITTFDAPTPADWLGVLIDTAQDALDHDGGYLSADERQEIAAAVIAARQAAPTVGAERLDALAHQVCQKGGHIPNRDRALPGSCDFHRRMAEGYVATLGLVAPGPQPATGDPRAGMNTDGNQAAREEDSP